MLEARLDMGGRRTKGAADSQSAEQWPLAEPREVASSRSDKTCEDGASCATGSYGEEEGERGKDLALQDQDALGAG